MLGEGDKDRLAGGTRKDYLRSVSWTDRSPTKPHPRRPPSGKGRSCLPPLQPLRVTRQLVEEWPMAGPDDLGVWPDPQTPRGSIKPIVASSGTEPPVREFQFKKDKLAFFDKECSRIADHIYLGSDAVAKNREILRQNGITHVLNCVGFVCPEYFKSDLVYKTLWLQDSPSEDITSILYDVFDYFEDVREQRGRVLVHCCQGVSRSTSLVIAYLMWREGQSFEDAFQYVKAARGVTNPNMGFACQLLQCQKRVHAVPASPNSVLRMYRMAPHSSYDPLHLVPKMLNHPSVRGLDSRGAFIVHVPSVIYVWIGKNCSSVMSASAGAAANQVVRYERAQGPIVSVREGEEPVEFCDALVSEQVSEDGYKKMEVKKAETCMGSGERRVDEYDLDFEIFRKALAGGVVPPFSVSNTGLETCLPARENGWGRLRQKFANGIMKEFLTSSKLNCDFTMDNDEADMIEDTLKETEDPSSPAEFSSELSPATYPCGSPDSFDCFPNSSPDRITDTCTQVGISVPHTDPSLPLTSPCSSPDSFSSFSCFPGRSPKLSSKSPTASPSASDSSSFTFSPSSSNWSDLSYMSSRQPSPSGLEPTDPFSGMNAFMASTSCLLNKGNPSSPRKEFSANHTLRAANIYLPCKGAAPSLAERRGSNPPPPMFLPSVDEQPQAPRNLVRSWSFSQPDSSDIAMTDVVSSEELMLDANKVGTGNNLQRDVEDKHRPLVDMTDNTVQVTISSLYQWPSMNKVEIHGCQILDSKSSYILSSPGMSFGTSSPGIFYIWLGSEALNQNGRIQLIGSDGAYNDEHVLCEEISRSFKDQMGLPVDTFFQVIREGEEPEQFLNHLSGFSFQKAKEAAHN